MNSRSRQIQKLQITASIISFMVSITCCAFVVYQTDKCIKKFIAFPKSTEVSIAKASKHDYPDMSFCDADFRGFENELSECNLTRNQYDNQHIWHSNVSQECMDPEKLFSKITGKPTDIISEIIIIGFENNVTYLDLDDLGLFEKKFYSKKMYAYSRCFILKLPPNIEIMEISFYFKTRVDILFYSSKSSLNVDESLIIYSEENSYIKTSIMYDTFQVLDLDGQPCGEYENSRDDCLEREIAQMVMEKVGCTSPYQTNQSNICTDPEKGKIAEDTYIKMIHNTSLASILCPKTCKFQTISTKNFQKKKAFLIKKVLQVKFEEFIKVSTSSPSYTFLELMAEVGGYVGLFLGVSINQTIDLLSKLAIITHSFCMKIQVKYFLK